MLEYCKGGSWQQVPANSVLYRVGSPITAPTLALLRTGTVRYGNSKQLLKSGDLLGLEFEASPLISVEVRTETDCELYCWEPEHFETVVGSRAEFAVEAIARLSERLRGVNRELELLSRREIAQKLLKEGRMAEARAYLSAVLDMAHQPATGNESFDLQDQTELDPDPGVQQGLYQFAFMGLDGLTPDLEAKYGRRYAAGNTIFREGDEADALYLICQGEVEISLNADLEGGDRRHLTRLREGEMFGEMALFDQRLRSATAVAATPCQLLAFTEDNFKMVFQLHPAWSRRLMRALAERLLRSTRLLNS